MMKRTTPALVSQEDMSQQRAYASEVAARKQRPQTYCVITYGCQMNAHDSEQLAGMLREMGMCEAENKEDADLVLYNTCCVRENAERRALGNVMWLKQRKEQKPDLIIGVCGCMMQQPHMAERLLRQYRFVDIAFGTHNLYRFPEYMLRVLETRRQVVEILPDEDVRIAEEMPIERVNPYNAYVNIMFGCNNFCSYCIVPYVRGRERSRAADDILREVEGLLQAGVQEIMLLGQNVNSYGNDLEGTLSFPQLLRRLDAMGVPRIRFMTSHPKDLSDALIDAMAQCPHICRHMHLPVQAGSDAILQAMNRRYTRTEYLSRLDALRTAMPDIGVTTDFIVGFPGETDADFEDTLALTRQARYDAAYTFIYSAREGTRAAAMPNHVLPAVASERIGRLIAVQEEVTAAIYQSLLGTRHRVLVEEPARRDDTQVTGKCERSITCNLTGGAELLGRIVPVVIDSAGRNTLRATQIHE